MRLGPIGIAFATACIAMTPALAQPLNDLTEITVNEPIMIPGKVLPAGHYEFSLLDTDTARNIVEIRNTKTDEATIVIGLNDYRTRPTDKTVVEFWETPSGDPPALRAWFYPGQDYGVEFAYPATMAKKIAEHTQRPVPNYEAGEKDKLDRNTAKKIPLKDVPQKKTMSRR